MLLPLVSNHQWLLNVGSSLSTLISNLSGPGVMLLAIGDSSFLSLLEGNDLLIVVLSTGKSWGHMAYFVGMTVIGSVIGCLILYSIGRKGGNPMLRRKFSLQSIDRAERLFERYGILTILISSILPPPMPLKIFVLSAGAFRLKTIEFVTGVLIGRTIRYSIWGILAVLYGNSVKLYMQKNLHVIGMILVGVIMLAIVGGYLYYIKQTRIRRNN
jgi:membrane protein DedA with SNARE-associated domain